MNAQTKKKVLIVDDEQDLRDAIATSLGYEGFTTLTAANGQEGLKLALQERPDLILLDLMMPKLDGMGMLGKLRENDWGKDANVIIMTALDDLSKVAEAIEKGGLEYIVKSNITLAEIVEKVKIHLP